MEDIRFNDKFYLGGNGMNRDEALAWIADIFEESPDAITLETDRDHIAGWDSMGVLAFMAGLDNDFDILLSVDEMQGVTKVGDIIDILQRYGKIQ